MGVNAMTPEPPGGTRTLGPNGAMSPFKSSEMGRTTAGTWMGCKIDESTYFTFTADGSSPPECNGCGLMSGGALAFGVTRLGGQEAAGSAGSGYEDGWRPAGVGSVLSVLPQANLYSLPDPSGVRIYEGTGTLSFDGSNVPQAELPRSASKTTTYFTTYDQATGIYFEYFAGSTLPSGDSRFGRVNRRYDTKGNVIQYNYAKNATGKALLRSLTGDIAGGVLPYFYYADETIDATHAAPVTKIALIDTANAANTRTTYFEYQNYTDAGGKTYPYLSKVINPSGCVQLYDPIIPFDTLGGNTSDAFQIKREVDAEGYATYFTYGGTALTQVAEPEGRIVYYEYTPTGETRQIATGRPKRTMTYMPSTFGGHIPLVTKDVDALGNTTYFGYNNLSLARMTQAIQPNGNLTYFQYVNSGQNKYALSLSVSAFNNAVTYFGYNGAYDLVKQVGPRWTAGTTVEVRYYTYDGARNRTAMIDALGNQTLYGIDSLGRLIRQQDARGNTSYFNYSSLTGTFDSRTDAAGNVSYFGYNAFMNRTAEVSPRWVEQGSFQAFTTYYEYDKRAKRTKTIDPQGNVTYFDYTARGDLLDQVDALGTVTANNYNSLRLRTQTTVTDRSGVLLSKTQDGFDIYKNRIRTLDGRGNAAYFYYDNVDRLASQVDSVQNVIYYYYDSLGMKTVQTDPRNSSSYYFYDQLTRNTATRDALANSIYYFYDLGNNLTAELDPRGTARYFFYDALDRPFAVRDALANPTYYFYDSTGNRAVLRNARFASTYFGYDQLNRRTRMQDALGNTTYYTYDARGNQTRVIDARSNVVTTSYDTLDRQAVLLDALSNPTYFGYDPVGNRIRTMDARFNTAYFFFDGLRRATAERDALAQVTYYFYDLIGNRTVVANPRASATYFGYDALNRQSALLDALGNAAYYFYDQASNRTRLQDARQFTTYYAYDKLNRKSAVQDALGNVTYYAYDQAGNRIRTIDPRANASTFAYDALNRLAGSADALGQSTYYFYDPVGNRAGTQGPRLFSTYYGYDALNRLAATQDALGNAAYFGYDPVGNKTRVKNARGFATYFGYDALNRSTAVLDALGFSTYFAYDAVGNRTTVIDARGNLARAAFDAVNRKIVDADFSGAETLFRYDQAGNVTAVNRGALGYGLQPYGISTYGGSDGVTTYYFYDALDRNTAVRDPLAGLTYYFYDQVGNKTRVQNPLLHTTYFACDALNRVLRTQEAAGGSTYFAYDPAGNLIQQIDPDAHQTLTRYDQVNRADATLYADQGSVYYFYDQAGNRTRTQDPRANTTYFGYDALDRLQRIMDALGKGVYFEYDGVGNLTKFIDAEGASSAFTYDAVNQKTNAAYAAAGLDVADGLGAAPYFVYDPVGNTTQMGDLWGLHRMAYDAGSRLSTHQFPNGSVVYFEYDARSNATSHVYPGSAGISSAVFDALDRQTSLKAPSGAWAYFTYDAASNLAQKVLGDGVRMDASYDPSERIRTYRWSKSSAAPLSYFEYTRDLKGLITKSVREATYTVYYAYDACDRLTMEVWAQGVTEVYGYRYAYDLAGNRTKARTNGADTYYEYDQANQLTRKGTTALFASATYYTYDQNGSLVILAEPGGTTKFAYNAAGLVARMRWKDASSTYFFYDGMLQRYASIAAGTSAATYFLWDGMDVLQQQNADGTVKEEYTQAKRGVPGIGQLVEVNRPGQAQAKLYPVMDPRGTITKYLQTDGTTVFASREYDAFGNLIPNSSSGTWPGVFGYQGQAWQEISSADAAQRLLLSPARIYDPSLGRFLGRDPIALDNLLKARPALSLYPYVSSNPANMVDPDGRDSRVPDAFYDEKGNKVGPWPGGGGYWRYYSPRATAEQSPSHEWFVAAAALGAGFMSFYNYRTKMYEIWTPVFIPDPPNPPPPPPTAPQNIGIGNAFAGIGGHGGFGNNNLNNLINLILGPLPGMGCPNTNPRPMGYGCISLGMQYVVIPILHLSIQYWEACPAQKEWTSDEPQWGTISPSNGQPTDFRELYRSSDIRQYTDSPKQYGHYAVTGRGGLFERWSWMRDTIGFILKRSAGFGTYYSDSRVMYHDDHEDEPSFYKWSQIKDAADSYGYAEQWAMPLPQNLKNWPNSVYQLGWPVPENNSNTFVRTMANLLPRDPDDYLTGLNSAPGNRVPKPIEGTAYNLYQSILGPSVNNPFTPPTTNPASNVLWPPLGYTLGP